MKVLYITESYMASDVHHSMCNALSEAGDDVCVTLFNIVREKNYKNKADTYGVKEYILKNVYLNANNLTYFLYKYNFFYKYRAKCRALLKAININDYDVIYASTLCSEGYLAYNLSRKFATPYVCAVRGTDLNLYLKKLFYLWPLLKRVITKARGLVFVTENIKKGFCDTVLGRSIDLNSIRYSIIHNGINDYWLRNITPFHPRREVNNFLYIGSFDFNKNVERMVLAFEMLVPKYPSIKLTLVGGGSDHHEQIMKLVENDKKHIQFLGKIYDKDELKKVFAYNDVFVLVSHSETFGLVYIEAISQGLPIIYTRGQGIDGTFSEKDRIGRAVDSYSEKEIMDAMEDMITNYNQYSVNSELSKNFSWENSGRKLFGLLVGTSK